ncbi:hypothetical protein ES705_15647 [subsurface metagenome]
MTLKDFYLRIYGNEVVQNVLKKDDLEIRNDITELKHFFKRYRRIKSDSANNFSISGCITCLDKGLAIMNQDFPGWIGELKDKDYIVIGLEISPKVDYDIHICYDLYKNSDIENHLLFRRFNKIFENIKEKSYITDIAKCLSTNPEKSRKICLRNFEEELILLHEINPNFCLIIQGVKTAEKYLK